MADWDDFTNACATLGALLDYPAEDYFDRMAACRCRLHGSFPDAAQAIGEFQDHLAGCTLGAVEEVYTGTFDVGSRCIPYVSVHLFGEENVKRGVLMARFLDAFVRYEFNPGSELPDHLGVLLRFMPYLSREEGEELRDLCLLEPVGKMVELLKKTENPYAPLLSAMQMVLATAMQKEHCDD